MTVAPFSRRRAFPAAALALAFLPSKTLAFIAAPPAAAATGRPVTTFTAAPSKVFARTSSTLSSSPGVVDVEKDSSEIVDSDGNPRKVGLALRLDDGTRKSHSMAQNTAFVSGFFKGIGTKDSYSKLVAGLHFVYREMEDAFDNCEDDRVRTMDNPKLRRAAALETDMEYFFGSNWSQTVEASPSAARYVDRVKSIASTEPYLLVAHQYTRYLGDLFGGQMMGGMASRSLGLDDGKGTTFYRFDEIESTYEFITEWYKDLNGLDLTEEQKEAIVDEANLVFDLNVGLLEELEGNPFQAMWTLALREIQSRIGLGAKA